MRMGDLRTVLGFLMGVACVTIFNALLDSKLPTESGISKQTWKEVHGDYPFDKVNYQTLTWNIRKSIALFFIFKACKSCFRMNHAESLSIFSLFSGKIFQVAPFSSNINTLDCD